MASGAGYNNWHRIHSRAGRVMSGDRGHMHSCSYSGDLLQ